MVQLTNLNDYTDDDGNVVSYGGPPIATGISVLFRGRGNRLLIDPKARIGRLNIRFDCDNGTCRIGPSAGVGPFHATIRVGQDAVVEVGRDVSCTTPVQISAVEGASVTIGDDVMIASAVKIRGDDGHPIFDVRTGLRVNTASPIVVGNHVWLGMGSLLLGGAQVAEGSVVGAGAIVTRSFPNNVVVAGVPGKIVRRDIAWERPHLSLAKPYYKPDASTVKKSAYWNLTAEDQ